MQAMEPINNQTERAAISNAREKIENLMLSEGETIESFTARCGEIESVGDVYKSLPGKIDNDSDRQFFEKLYIDCMEYERFMALLNGHPTDCTLELLSHALKCYDNAISILVGGTRVYTRYLIMAEILKRLTYSHELVFAEITKVVTKGEFYHPELPIFAALLIDTPMESVRVLGASISEQGHDELSDYIGDVETICRLLNCKAIVRTLAAN
jgi:hypothetical protein